MGRKTVREERVAITCDLCGSEILESCGYSRRSEQAFRCDICHRDVCGKCCHEDHEDPFSGEYEEYGGYFDIICLDCMSVVDSYEEQRKAYQKMVRDGYQALQDEVVAACKAKAGVKD